MGGWVGEWVCGWVHGWVGGSCRPRGGLVQAWESECCGVEGIPVIEIENKIQLFKFPLVENNIKF